MAEYRGYSALIHAISPQHDPELIEALMRQRHRTLDSLSHEVFRREVSLAVAMIAAAPEAAARLARLP